MTRVVLGLAHLTALELSPPGLVAAAARAGFASVGLRVVPATTGGPAYPTRVGTEAHRALKQILAAEGVRVSDIEFIQLTPDIDVQAFAGVFEAAADLGAISVTVSGDDHDRHIQQLQFVPEAANHTQTVQARETEIEQH